MAVASGELVEGDSLPSVRQLSRTLRVNPATVVQAYRELEMDGFVEMRHGAGTFVQAVSAPVREEERQRLALEIARQALASAARLRLPASALIDALQSLIDEGVIASTSSESP